MASVKPNHDDEYAELRTMDQSTAEPNLKMEVAFSPFPKPSAAARARPADLDGRTDPSPVRNIVSRFEKKQEQSLDALPFRTVRHFFDGDRSIHVTDEKLKYDALTARQREEALLAAAYRSPELSATRARTHSDMSAASLGGLATPAEENNLGERSVVVERKLDFEFADESNQTDDEQTDEASVVTDTAELFPETTEQTPPPPPPPPAPPVVEALMAPLAEEKQFVNTPDQKIKKRPMLTTERSFVMEEDHTIETEDLIVVGERFSTDGEDDREMLLEMLERELRMLPEDQAELREAMKANPAKARMMRRAYNQKKLENVPSKLFAPTAASLASRTTKSPSAARREPAKSTPKQVTSTATSSAAATTPTRKSSKYANVQSKVKEMMKPTPLARKSSDASDTSLASSKSSMSARRSTMTSQQKGSASVDRRSFMSNKSSRRSSGINRTLGDIHGDDAHSDWEGRHRTERLSFASSMSSVDSSDPLALQLSYTARKTRYDNIKPRYLDYGKDNATYTRNKEAQEERRKKLEEKNAAKSTERQKQLKFQLSLKEKREKDDVEAAVRRGEELHKMTQLIREKEKTEELERRLSQSAIRRALSSTGSDLRRAPSTSSVGASSPRTSLLSEPDSLPSSSTSAAPTNAVFAA